MDPIVRHKIITAVMLALALIISGTIIYSQLEGWNLVDSLYFTVMTLTTIGYGDLVPSYSLSRLFTVFYAITGVGTFLYTASIIAEHYFYNRVQKLETSLVRIAVKKENQKDKVVKVKRAISRAKKD